MTPEIIPGTISDPAYAGALSAYEAYFRIRYERHYGTRPRGQPSAHRTFRRFFEVGKLCADNTWSPDEYVEFCLSSASYPDALSPKQLASPECAVRYKTFLATGGIGTAVSEWTAGETSLKALVGPDRRFKDPELALANLDLSFTSWFRVLFPWPPSESLYRLFGEEAYGEILRNRGLLQALTELCPAQLDEMQNRYGKFPGAVK